MVESPFLRTLSWFRQKILVCVQCGNVLYNRRLIFHLLLSIHVLRLLLLRPFVVTSVLIVVTLLLLLLLTIVIAIRLLLLFNLLLLVTLL